MAKFRFEVLAPGKRCVGRNPDGSKRWANFTADYVRNKIELGNQMLAAGINVPFCLGHLNSGRPVKKSRDELIRQKELGTLGWTEKYELSADGKGFVNVEVPDPEDAKTVQKVRFCSPRLERFTDGDGKDWGEVFTHVALTSRPIQHHQSPAMQLSLTDGALELSIDPLAGIDLAADEEVETPTETEAEPTEIEALIAALKEKGFNIPDEVKDLTHLVIAIKACHIPDAEETLEEEEGPEEPEEEPEEGLNPPSGVQENPERPYVMSHDKGVHRKSLRQRVTKLFKSGRITGPIKDRLLRQAKTIDLSLDAQGTMASNMLSTQIEAYEALAKETAWTRRAPMRTDLAHGTSEVALPKELSGESSDAELLDAWDKVGAAPEPTPRPEPKPAPTPKKRR